MVRFDSLDTLDSSKYEWTIKVRVIRIWDSYSSRDVKEFKGRNMLLLDDKHNRMHAFIWPNYMSEYKNTFEEGKIYSIRNFDVKTYRKESLRCTRSDKQIWFSNYTKVSVIEDDEKSDKMIRRNEFDFFEISDIPEILKESETNYLIDVIGVLQDKDSLRHFTNQRGLDQCSYRFTITDGSSSIKLCFWDDLAESFEKTLDKISDETVIVIVASCKINEYKGEPYVSNVAATRFYINYDHRSVDLMRQRSLSPDFKKNGLNPGDQDITRIMTLSNIRQLGHSFIMKKVMCQVIVRTVRDNAAWSYDSCTSCQEEVDTINGKCRCEKCKRTIPFPDKRFRLCLVVEDGSGGAAVILHDREVGSMLGKTVYDVVIEHEREVESSEFPSVLKMFEGKEYTITILLTEDNILKGSQTYDAVDIYEGFEVIENTAPGDDDSSGCFGISQTSAQYSTSRSFTNSTFKTPDTGKSASTKNLKRMSNDGIPSITNIDDNSDEDESEDCVKNKIPLKQVKIEKI